MAAQSNLNHVYSGSLKATLKWFHGSIIAVILALVFGTMPPRDSPCFMWTGVLNNPTEAETQALLDIQQLAKEIVVDSEIGEKEGTHHNHIYVSMKAKQRLASM